MEFEKEYLCLEQNSCVFSKALDCEEEYQQALPQYCDDILRVIKCTSKNIITSNSINNGEIKIYGKTFINLTYLNESNVLTYADFEEDFVKTVNYDKLTDSSFISTNICDKYTNYRVINQRRIDIHNAFNINICIYDKVSCPCVKSCENSKLRKNSIKCSNVMSNCITKCEFDEEISIPADSKPIKRIIGYSGFVTLNETKTIKDKALVKANVTINVLYTEDCDEEVISKCVHNFDISKIVDISGLEETDNIITKLNLGNVFLKSKNAADGCLNIIELIGEVNINLTVVREKEISYITDGYVVNKKSKCTYQEFKSNKNCKKVCDTIQKDIEININSTITNIVDVGLNINDVNLKNNSLIANIASNVLYRNDNNELCDFQSNEDVTIFKDDFDNGIANVDICNYEFTIKDSNTIKIRITLKYNAILYFEVQEKVLSEIECDDEFVDYPALTIYFAKENELVWNIAKRFSSDTELIIKENQLKEERLSTNKVLIIPGI